MANYALSINSTFNPFTYQELVAPVAHQQQVLDNLAEQYDKLSTQADILEAMGNDDRDKNSGTYNRYKSYSDALRKERDYLYEKGLDTESRRRLSELRTRYNTDIVPIQNAWNKREQEAEMQMKARIQNPNIRFTRDAASTSLADYISNPTGGFGVVNLNNITADMAAAAKVLEKQIRSGYNKDIDDYTFEHINRFGLDPNFISEWMSNPDVSPSLTNMMNQVLAKHGVTAESLQGSTNMNNILREGMDAARLGAWQAVGEDRAQQVENYGNRLNAQIAKELYTARAKAALSGEGGEGSGSASLPGETFDINFNDPESAGVQMKKTLANATLNFLRSSNDSRAKKYLESLENSDGGADAAIEKWSTDGLNGKDFKDRGLYYQLGEYLRNHVTKDENLINTWRSDYNKHDKKEWKDFDKRSSNGYHVSAIQLNDKSSQLESYLDRVLSRNFRDGKVKLYDIKKISGDGTYTYSDEGTSIADLPHNSSGKELDYKRIHRALLSNGDYMLYWTDNQGNSVQKVLRRQDIGNQAMRDWNTVNQQGYQSAFKMYTDGKISREEFNTILGRLGSINMFNGYLDTQEVNVKDYDLE